MFIGVYTIPVLVTYLGLISSMLAAAFSINGNFKMSIILLMLAAIFDLFDGMLARKLNKTEKENLFGIQIDSIIDVCSFGVVPTIIGYNMGLNTVLDLVIFGMYICGATMRLAYFNCLALAPDNKDGDKPKKKYFLGLPVTFSAIIFPLVFVLSFIITNGFNPLILRIAYLLIAVLFITNVKLPKPTGVWYYIFPAIMILWSILTIVVL